MSSRVTARARQRDDVSTGLPESSAWFVPFDVRVSALIERREPGAGRALLPRRTGTVECCLNVRREGADVAPRSITFDVPSGRVVEVPVPLARQVDPLLVRPLDPIELVLGGRFVLPTLLPEFRAEPVLEREGVGGVYVG